MKRRSDFSNMEEYVSYLEVLVDEMSVQVQSQMQAMKVHLHYVQSIYQYEY